MESAPSSDLSDYASDDFPEEVKPHARSASPERRSTRPSKRQRLDHSPDRGIQKNEDDIYNEYLSSDTEGSVPPSPTHPSDTDDYDRQVTVCKWEGCDGGDQGNMDALVEHLHDNHIVSRQKKYSCEWIGCGRKGTPHASGYALKAHIRSHTREKPFFCSLPECDRSFTRSDALAKHMRTVHETEALRPSDPVPKHHSSKPAQFQRLRLVFNKTGSASIAGPDGTKPSLPVSPSIGGPGVHQDNDITYLQDPNSPNGKRIAFPPDVQFEPSELALTPGNLHRLLRRQEHWAFEESQELKTELDQLEKIHKDEFMQKHLILENVMEEDLLRMMRKRQEIGVDVEGLWPVLEEDLGPARRLKYGGDKIPWWRRKNEEAITRPPPGDSQYARPPATQPMDVDDEQR